MRRLTSHQDAFGLEMRSYLKGGSPLEIVERDDGYIDTARSTEQYFALFENWPKRQRRGIALVRGRTVLDVGCGAGRVSLYLQKKGFRVTAIDISPIAIRICKQRGVKNPRVLGIDDIGRLRPMKFDAVVLFGNNFGLFGNIRRAKRLLRQLHRLTSDPCGRCCRNQQSLQDDQPIPPAVSKAESTARTDVRADSDTDSVSGPRNSLVRLLVRITPRDEGRAEWHRMEGNSIH